MTYWIIFWGNSTHSDNIFGLKKGIIRIIMGARTRDTCRELLKNLKILPLTFQYVVLALFVVNRSLFMENSHVHSIKTRNDSNLFYPSPHLMIYE